MVVASQLSMLGPFLERVASSELTKIWGSSIPCSGASLGIEIHGFKNQNNEREAIE